MSNRENQPLLPITHTPSDEIKEPALTAHQQTDLDRIVEYASLISPLTRRDKLIYGSIALITVVAPVSYLRPAYADKPFALPNTPPFKSIQVVSTWVPTSYLFYSADIDFLKVRAANIVPTQLQDILKGPTEEELFWQDRIIAFISGLSAIPLTTPLVEYPLIGYDSDANIFFNSVLIALILAGNSIAHLRPLLEIVIDPVYGAPITLGRWLKKKYNEHSLSTEEKLQLRDNEEKVEQTALLKANWVKILHAKKELLLDSCFKPKPKWRIFLEYELTLSDQFNEISVLNDHSFVTELMAYTPPGDLPKPTGGKIYNFFHSVLKYLGAGQKTYDWSLSIISQLGALWVLAESVGYLSNTGFTLSEMCGNSYAGWFLAAVPMWAFGVLMHMFGRDAFRGNIDFLIGYAGGTQSLSWPIKYRYKTYFWVCFAPNLVMSYMTPGSANTMIRGDLTDYWGEDNTETYIGVSRWAFVALVLFLLPAMDNYFFRLDAKYFGTDDSRKLVEFEEKVEKVANSVSKWKDSRFLGEPEPTTPPPNRDLSGLSSSPSSQDIRPRQSWCDWFCCRSPKTSPDFKLDHSLNA